MKIAACLVSLALAKDFKCNLCDLGETPDIIEDCPADWTPEKSFMVDCNDKDGSHCFTTQRTWGDGSVKFKRGCSAPLLAGLKEGCLDTDDGTVCYKACKEEGCNVDMDLTPEPPVTEPDCPPCNGSITLAGSLALLLGYIFA